MTESNTGQRFSEPAGEPRAGTVERHLELRRGDPVELDQRRWVVSFVNNGVALLVACRQRHRERERPTRYLNVKHGLGNAQRARRPLR